MNSLFALLIGHLVGDFLFQTDRMAQKKAQKGMNGALWCTFHAAAYTTCVCLCLWTRDPLVIGLIFLSHWPLDRYGMGAKWTTQIKGFDVAGAFKSGNQALITLAIIIPIAVDNTLHLLLMWPIVRFLL